MVDENKAAQIVEPILRKSLEPLGLERLEIADSFDHDGDPIVLATVHYRAGAPKLRPRVLLDAIVEAMASMSNSGDNRILIVRNIFADGEAAREDFRPQSAPRRRKAAGK